MTLDDENGGKGLKLVPGTFGMNVPSACTIVIIAGTSMSPIKDKYTIHEYPSLGKYLDRVDRVMTQVDRITEDIDHMPVAAFIFRDKESRVVHYSVDLRLTLHRYIYIYTKRYSLYFHA